MPNEPVWDYAVAARRGGARETIHWIEIHPASAGHCMEEVRRKLEWLSAWLNGAGKRLRRADVRFIWIASGKVCFQRNAPGLRGLAQMGLVFAGEHYDMRD